jgi:hypothetical protein
VVDGLLRRHRQDWVVAPVVGDRLRELGFAADGDVGDRVEAEGGLAALGYLERMLWLAGPIVGSRAAPPKTTRPPVRRPAAEPAR